MMRQSLFIQMMDSLLIRTRLFVKGGHPLLLVPLWPQNLQFIVAAVDEIPKLLHSRILQIKVPTQDQLSEVGGVELQSRGQPITAVI